MKMSLQIQVGKYYRTRIGDIVGPARICHGTYCVKCSGGSWDRHGSYYEGESNERDLVSEVSVQFTPILPFQLRAGVKYDTQKPDGTAGPVVELERTSDRGWQEAYCNEFPFVVLAAVYVYSVTRSGTLMNYHNDAIWSGYRIVAEHIEPKPPTAIERLESLSGEFGEMTSSKCCEMRDELRSIIADLKAGAK